MKIQAVGKVGRRKGEEARKERKAKGGRIKTRVGRRN